MDPEQPGTTVEVRLVQRHCPDNQAAIDWVVYVAAILQLTL